MLSLLQEVHSLHTTDRNLVNRDNTPLTRSFLVTFTYKTHKSDFFSQSCKERKTTKTAENW